MKPRLLLILIYELKDGTGKVREFYYDGKLKFEGEYLNGLRNGKGKEYTKKQNLICPKEERITILIKF